MSVPKYVPCGKEKKKVCWSFKNTLYFPSAISSSIPFFLIQFDMSSPSNFNLRYQVREKTATCIVNYCRD